MKWISFNLTVVIPNLNYGRYLGACLKSLDKQTMGDFEVILVDGGSTDETFEVLKDYPQVKIINDTPPQGPVKAVNKAMLKMNGRYFTQLNADCILNPTIYEKCIKALEAHPEVGMVYTGWYNMNDREEVIGRMRQPKHFDRDRLLRGNYIDATSMVIRRRAFERVGHFDERCPRSMDWIMAVKLAHSFPILFINEALFYYRVHPSQMTQSPKQAEDTKRALGIIRGYYGSWAKFKANVYRLGRKVLK